MNSIQVAKELVSLARCVLAVKTSDMDRVLQNAVNLARDEVLVILRQKQIPSYLRSVASAVWLMKTNSTVSKPTIVVEAVAPKGVNFVFARGRIRWNRVEVIVEFSLGPVHPWEVNDKIRVIINLDGREIVNREQYGVEPKNIGKEISDDLNEKLGFYKLPIDQQPKNL